MSVILGKNVYIYDSTVQGAAIVAAAKSCTISKSVDIIEKASTTQGSAKEFTTGRYEWEVSINHLVVSTAPFEGILMVGNTYGLEINIETNIGVVKKTGNAICTQADIQGATGNLATGSVKFKGTGLLV